MFLFYWRSFCWSARLGLWFGLCLVCSTILCFRLFCFPHCPSECSSLCFVFLSFFLLPLNLMTGSSRCLIPVSALQTVRFDCVLTACFFVSGVCVSFLFPPLFCGSTRLKCDCAMFPGLVFWAFFILFYSMYIRILKSLFVFLKNVVVVFFFFIAIGWPRCSWTELDWLVAPPDSCLGFAGGTF